MASVNDRLRRLEAGLRPPVEATPEMDLLLKSMAHARAEIEFEEGTGPDPGPLVLTPAEEELERRATREFLPYLLEERERAGPHAWEALDEAIEETRAEIAKLDEEDAA